MFALGTHGSRLYMELTQNGMVYADHYQLVRRSSQTSSRY